MLRRGARTWFSYSAQLLNSDFGVRQQYLDKRDLQEDTDRPEALSGHFWDENGQAYASSATQQQICLRRSVLSQSTLVL